MYVCVYIYIYIYTICQHGAPLELVCRLHVSFRLLQGRFEMSILSRNRAFVRRWPVAPTLANMIAEQIDDLQQKFNHKQSLISHLKVTSKSLNMRTPFAVPLLRDSDIPLIFWHRLDGYLASWEPSPPGKLTSQNCILNIYIYIYMHIYTCIVTIRYYYDCYKQDMCPRSCWREKDQIIIMKVIVVFILLLLLIIIIIIIIYIYIYIYIHI